EVFLRHALHQLGILHNKVEESLAGCHLHHLHLPPVFEYHRMRDHQSSEMFHLTRSLVEFLQFIMLYRDEHGRLNCFNEILRRRACMKGFLAKNYMTLCGYLNIDFLRAFLIILSHETLYYEVEIIFNLAFLRNDGSLRKSSHLDNRHQESCKLLIREIDKPAQII